MSAGNIGFCHCAWLEMCYFWSAILKALQSQLSTSGASFSLPQSPIPEGLSMGVGSEENNLKTCLHNHTREPGPHKGTFSMCMLSPWLLGNTYRFWREKVNLWFFSMAISHPNPDCRPEFEHSYEKSLSGCLLGLQTGPLASHCSSCKGAHIHTHPVWWRGQRILFWFFL